MSLHNAPAIVISDLGNGDSGKGTTIDFLAELLGSKSIVRTGGPQALHNVVRRFKNRVQSHCFAQFASASMQEGVVTYLSSKMLVAPEALLREAESLREKVSDDPLSRVYFSGDSVVVTPWHAMFGQMLELTRGKGRHGSCGVGVGQAIYDSEAGLKLTVADMLEPEILKKRLQKVYEAKRQAALELLAHSYNEEAEARFKYFMVERGFGNIHGAYVKFADKIRGQVRDERSFVKELLASGQVIFEGSQGALIDRHYGFFPYITKSSVTHHNASAILSFADPSVGRPYKLGIIRAYGHRHGPGPFPTEDERLGRVVKDKFNKTSPWQGKFRIGWLDLPLLRYGIAANDGVDGLAVTCLDQLSGLPEVRVCTSYAYSGNDPELEKYFNVDWSERWPVITGIKKMTEGRDKAAAILANCRPRYMIFRGWNLGSRYTSLKSLPINAENFLRFLEGPDGLGVRIQVISYGPRSDQKALRGRGRDY